MSAQRYWFAAKRYGWGWGLPLTWQGWCVYLGFALSLVAGFFLFPPGQALPEFLLWILVINAVLFGICYIKGEPPKWRWGGE